MSNDDLDQDQKTADAAPATGTSGKGRAGKGRAAPDSKKSPKKPPKKTAKKTAKKATKDDDDHVVDLEEELHPDDVEDPLDVLLKEKTASEGLDADEAEIEAETDDAEPGERNANRIAPRQPDEFLCSSCFLVLPLSQLADKKRQLCRDCA